MSHHWPRAAAALVALACGSLANAGDAPAQLEEVIVTATLRATPLQLLPASATVLGERTLADSANQHLEEVLPQVPSLSWAGASSRPRYFLLRGIGELEQYQGAPNPSVGFLVDEIDYSGVGMVATLFDVEQVEVLRGPQGTRNGANALAGLIKLKTHPPQPVPELVASAGVAGDGQWDAGVIAGGALPGGETAAWRLAIQRQRSDGFRDNAFLGRDDTNGRTETTVRARARLEPAPGWDADLTVAYVDLDNGYDAFAIDNTYRTRSDRPGRDAQRSTGVALDQAWDLAPAVGLRSITSYADSRAVTSFDGDWGNARDWGAAGPYDFFSQTVRERRTLAQDLRLQSAAAGALDWVAGLYAQRLDEDNAQDDDGLYLTDAFTRSLDSSYRATSLAAYADATWRLDGAWALAGGLRLERRDARYADTDGFRYDPRDGLWGGQLSLLREAGGGHAYVTAARGYKAGGFNIGAAIPEDRLQFGPEHLWNLEAGYKRHATAVAFDMAVFWQRRGDQQVATSYQLDPEDPLTFVYFTDNAARGTAYGLEGSLQWRAAPPWQVEAALSLMRSRYDGYRYGDRDLTGRAWAHAPDYKYSVAATWRHPLGWMARVDLAGEGAFYYDTSHDQRAPDKVLVGLRAGYEASRWSVHAWVRNLFDERYATRGFYFGNEPPDFPPKLYLRLGDPRQVGVSAEWRL